MKRVFWLAMLFLSCLLFGCSSGLEAPLTDNSVPTIAVTAGITCNARSLKPMGEPPYKPAQIQPGETISAAPINCPLSRCYVNDFFGSRYYRGRYSMHYGIDFKTTGLIGNTPPVYAVANGKIVSIVYQRIRAGVGVKSAAEVDRLEKELPTSPTQPTVGAGLYITFKHSDGSSSKYLHLSSSTLNLPIYKDLATKGLPPGGISVAKGSQLAIAGNSGHQTYHLHLEYVPKNRNLFGGQVDPLPCITKLDPIIAVTAPVDTANNPLPLQNPGNFLLKNYTTDYIVSKYEVSQPAVFSITASPTIIKPADTQKLTVFCLPNASAAKGSINAVFYKGLNDSTKTQGWAIPTNLLSPGRILPKTNDLTVNINCKGGNPPPPANTPPVAKLTASPTSGNAPLTVTFDAAGSTDDKGITRYVFSAGANGTANTTSETFTQPGTYSRSVTVYDAEGKSSTASASVVVKDAGPVVGAKYTGYLEYNLSQKDLEEGSMSQSSYCGKTVPGGDYTAEYLTTTKVTATVELMYDSDRGFVPNGVDRGNYSKRMIGSSTQSGTTLSYNAVASESYANQSRPEGPGEGLWSWQLIYAGNETITRSCTDPSYTETVTTPTGNSVIFKWGTDLQGSKVVRPEPNTACFGSTNPICYTTKDVVEEYKWRIVAK